MIRLTENDWRIFRRLQRKHKVSTEFLRYNLENIKKFIWYQTWPRIIIKRYTIRKHNRVFIIYYRLRRVLFDQCNRKLFKRMRQNIKQWSKRMVTYLKTHVGIKEYVEEVVYENGKNKTLEKEINEKEIVLSLRSSNDVSKQLKEQLELLKSGRRQPPPLILTNESKTMTSEIPETIEKDLEIHTNSIESLEKQKSDNIVEVKQKLGEEVNNLKDKSDSSGILNKTPPEILNDKDETQWEWQINLESTPEKQTTTQENIRPMKLMASDEKTEKSHTEDDNNLSNSQQTEKLKTGLNFLDMLMSKVTASSSSNCLLNSNNNNNKSTEKLKEEGLSKMPTSNSLKEPFQYHQEHSMDSSDGFLGFDDCERIPGMLMTPIVPHSTKNNKNSVFVSESLNEYMRLNDLETNYSIDEDKSVIKSKIYARDMEGLMTPKTVPPAFDMPAVPENLLKFRTVAERKQYLQKFSKNYRLAIINNEASIYRELQRRMRTQKVKSASQQLAQSSNSAMSFTRNGWKAASFINTEFNKYYYQILEIDNFYKVRLRGARGNNDEFRKTPYTSRVLKAPNECPYQCVDERIWQDLKPIKTIIAKAKKLNNDPLPSVFKPCPLSHKTFQKPLDDDTAALLLAGGSMAVVRMPTVELEVFPEFGRPLHEIAKRYLQYILPHHDISREWAEFSVSTLQQPKSLKEAEQAAAKSFNSQDISRKSYTFVIPYLNDRNHILVRRVVDRSEKLDHSFENCLEEKELVPKNDFSFRQNLDDNDKDLLICADMVSDMINTVAISCSENSFIKNDPDAISTEDDESNVSIRHIKLDGNVLERPLTSSPITTAALGNAKKQKKQNSLLLELKRLNATIIDAAIKTESDNKPCSKPYCQMGCVCASLTEDLPMREHCGKSKCMLECTCKSSSQSRIMRLETDGRTITTEDAFMLRRKATARLARMEKEFTSTVVLTENETLLINETNNDKKRRCTKAPKRYEDFTDTEDEQRKNSPKKAALTTIDNEKNLAVEVKELREPVYVKDSILGQLKHCTVNLVPLQDMDNIAPWCMIHNLYKCYCKGRAIEGKPVVIEKEELNITTEHDSTEQSLELEVPLSVKPKYTFEKLEKRKKSSVHQDNNVDNGDDDVWNCEELEQNEAEEDNDEDDDWTNPRKRKRKEYRDKMREKFIDEYRSDNNSNQSSRTDDESLQLGKTEYRSKSTVRNLIEKSKPKPSLHEVRLRFFQSRDDCCRRQIPIPRRMFLYCNRKRRLNVLKFIKDNENEQTRLLLNEHVIRSVYYHKIDSESQKKLVDMSIAKTKEKQDDNVKPKGLEAQKLSVSEQLCKTGNTKRNSLLVNEIVDLLEDDEEEPQATRQENNSESVSLLRDKDESTQLTSSSTKSCTSFDNPTTDSSKQVQVCSGNKVITVKQFATLSTLSTDPNKQQQTMNAQNEKHETSIESTDAVKLPKISSCFSLNAKANLQSSSSKATPNEEQQHLDFTSATSVHSAAFSQNQTHQIKHTASPSTAVTSTVKTTDGSPTVMDLDNENVKDVYNSVIKTMNSLVSKKMQDIDCALQRESHIIPAPNADILCIMKWANFLDAFCEGFAYIWQVKMKDVTFFVVTICNMMPLIPGAMGIVNITALKPDRMPLIGKMLLQRVRNKETEKLAVVMQGKQSHWVVKGFLRADPTLACNKPTPESHPSLTKKINVLCSLLVKQRQREQKKKENLAGQWTSPQMAMATQTLAKANQTQATQSTPKVAQIMPIRRVTTVQQSSANNTASSSASTQQLTVNPQQSSPLLTQQLQQPISQIKLHENSIDTTAKPFARFHIVEGGKNNPKNVNRKRKIDTAISNNLMKADTYSKMSSNIEFRTVNENDISEISLPELIKLDHKWLVLDLHSDFSHIFVPDFRDLVSLDRIQKVLNFARQKNKIVKLQFFQNAPFDAFVTPKSGRKIYFGPLTMEMNAPTLILLQSVDGQMMLRELYQLQHNIVKKPEEKTKAFWLIHIKGQTHFEMDIGMNSEKLAELPATSALTPIAWNNITLITNAATPNALDLNKNVEKNNNDADADNADANDDDDDDEDCMIIDDAEDNNESKSQERYNFTIKTSLNDTTVSITPQANSLPGPLPIQTLHTFKANKTDSLDSPTATKSLLKVTNTNTIITSINAPIMASPAILNPTPITVTNTQLPFLSLPPNTVITGFNPTPVNNVNVGTHLFNLPANAVVTGIKPAPEESSYSSTIFITPAPSIITTPVLDVATTTTTSTASINNLTTLSTLTDTQLVTEEQTSKSNAKSMQNKRQSIDAATIKRRRISIFCSNKYDKISENLAVDAVMKNILPNNNDYIQINPMPEDTEKKTTKSTLVATVGSTRISKLNDVETKILNTRLDTEAESSKSDNSTKPIVFDVNFMDDGDEPTASIVIKPNTSAATSQTLSSSSSQACNVNVTTTTTSTIITTVTNTKNITNTVTTNVVTPKAMTKLPTMLNTPCAVAVAGSNTNNSGKEKLLNALLCAKQQKNTQIVPKFSAPQLIKPKPPNTAANSTSTSTAIQTIEKPITKPPSSSPLRRASLPLKVQKVVGATSSATTTAINITAANQPTSSATLTVQQVQAMLNKPGLNVASTVSLVTPTTTTTPATTSSMQLTISSTIKATIAPNNKVLTIPTTHTDNVKALQSSTAPSTSVGTSKVNCISNSTLTISKVQSFGLQSTKTQNISNTEKNLQSFAAPAPAPSPSQGQQIILNNISERLPTPPSHIQYGYIVSASYASHKFVAKRVTEEFYVKVPKVGILKLQGLGAVNTYLNKYINKTLRETPSTPVVWQFVAASKAVQMQNHQKSLLVRKAKTPIGSLGVARNKNAGANKSSTTDNTLNEPILIDD